jgi:branched-chain amino acid transport system substrate-binding protein
VRQSRRLIVLGIVSAMVLALSASFASGATRPQTPGISSNKVMLGAIVTQSGGLQADFAPYLAGVNAYLHYVNAAGGINKRKLDLAHALDDESSQSQDVADAQTLVNDDHVFAIVGVSTPFFTASTFLGKSGTPTFGYATGNVWSPAKNLFADYGSYLDYNSSVPFFAYVAKKTNSTKIAVVALSYPSSKDECNGAITGLKKYKFKVVYSNVNEAINQVWSTEATKIHNAKANMIVTCMDDGSSVSLSKDIAALYGSKPPTQLWLDGYDRTFLASNHKSMQNVYLMLQHVPFEAAIEYPSTFPGLELYFTEMAKYGYASDEYDDVALMGWESANLFADGLAAAGKNPTQKSLVTAINKITEDTGGPDGGVTAPTNWTFAHVRSGSPACETFVQVKGKSFALAFNNGSDPWICFPITGTANLDDPATPPAGTPGA